MGGLCETLTSNTGSSLRAEKRGMSHQLPRHLRNCRTLIASSVCGRFVTDREGVAVRIDGIGMEQKGKCMYERKGGLSDRSYKGSEGLEEYKIPLLDLC